MKYIIIILTLLFWASIQQVRAQNHPSVLELHVACKAVPYPTDTIANPSPVDIYVIQQATLTLVDSVQINKIYFNVIELNNDSIIYSASYLISDPSIVSPDGIIIFQKNNGNIYLSPGQIVGLKPYRYEIVTEDNLQNKYPAFSQIQ